MVLTLRMEIERKHKPTGSRRRRGRFFKKIFPTHKKKETDDETENRSVYRHPSDGRTAIRRRRGGNDHGNGNDMSTQTDSRNVFTGTNALNVDTRTRSSRRAAARVGRGGDGGGDSYEIRDCTVFGVRLKLRLRGLYLKHPPTTVRPRTLPPPPPPPSTALPSRGFRRGTGVRRPNTGYGNAFFRPKTIFYL